MKYLVYNECPIGCGCCCGFWKQALPHAEAVDGHCPNLGNAGCKLPRKERPAKCNEYLCRAASAALHGDLLLEDAKYLVSINEQGSHNKWDELLRARKAKVNI